MGPLLLGRAIGTRFPGVLEGIPPLELSWGPTAPKGAPTPRIGTQTKFQGRERALEKYRWTNRIGGLATRHNRLETSQLFRCIGHNIGQRTHPTDTNQL
jgi:hypothetical protein